MDYTIRFPFRNLAFNNLIEFFEIEKIKEYAEADKNSEYYKDSFFYRSIEIYKDRIPSFENELLQIIDTTGQETIDRLFEELAENIDYINQLLNRELLINELNQWNEEALVKYNSSIESKTKAFQTNPKRRKYKHLEEYEEYMPFMPISNYSSNRYVKQINYNIHCIEDKLEYIDPAIVDEYLILLQELSDLFIETAVKYGRLWHEGKIKSKVAQISLKPIIFFEGDLDIELVKKAAEHLGKIDILDKVELRQRGSCSNLDKLWNIISQDNWETVVQSKMLIYDCDTNRQNEDFGHLYRRVLPFLQDNIVKRGIENLFPNSTIERAIAYKREFVDFKKIVGTERGIQYTKEENIINRQEKRNFCNWVCQNGVTEDFRNFEIIFSFIENILYPKNATRGN